MAVVMGSIIGASIVDCIVGCPAMVMGIPVKGFTLTGNGGIGGHIPESPTPMEVAGTVPRIGSG